MPSPLILHTDAVGLFAPQYCASIRYYACLATYARACVDTDIRYDKRFKSAHRCTIVDTRGPLQLTVPTSKWEKPAPDEPRRVMTWSDVRVSSHGQWWSDHAVSWESAYGRTPFFEFYYDRFKPWLRDRGLTVTELDQAMDHEIRNILGLETDVLWCPASEIEGKVVDHRRDDFADIVIPQYYQVRQDKLGFIPDLSILDLIFNMGPESPLILKQAPHSPA